MPKKKINWKKLWEDFDKWWEEHQWKGNSNWYSQQKEIEKLLNKQLKEIKNGK